MPVLKSHANKRCRPPAEVGFVDLSQEPSARQVVSAQFFETDPSETAALWQKVRSCKYTAMPSNLDTGDKHVATLEQGQKLGRGRGRPRGKGKGQQTLVPPDEPSDTQSGTQSVASTSAYTAVETRSKASRITSHSPEFEKLILRPRRIFIEGNAAEANKPPYRHFKTVGPTKGERLDYKTNERLDAAEIWLSLTDESIDQIIEEYEFMTSKQVNEQEYASFATETFLRRQPRCCQTPADRKWRAERMLQLIAPPTHPNWHAPASFETDPDEFKYDIRPDCSYWLSLAGFNSAYRSELNSAVYVHQNWITCPYFTVEFKKHGQSKTQATWQAAAAASLALYNRYLLKVNALNVRGENWTESDKAQLRHYILTFVGAEYTVWILRATFSDAGGAWEGCAMRRLCDSRCTASLGIRRLESWINEIHRWGLLEHATSCEADIKIILADNEVDISMID